MVNYAPNPKFPREPDLTEYRRLAAMPFYFGLVEGGTHTFVGFRGTVSEFHWSADATEKDAIEHTPLAMWYHDPDPDDTGPESRRTQWGDGILAIPPGDWAASAR